MSVGIYIKMLDAICRSLIGVMCLGSSVVVAAKAQSTEGVADCEFNHEI